MERHDFSAGPDQLIVLYLPPDTGIEIDAVSVYGEIAADAEARAGSGWRIVTMDALNLRHAGVYFGQDGSGFETKASFVVVYAR